MFRRTVHTVRHIHWRRHAAGMEVLRLQAALHTQLAAIQEPEATGAATRRLRGRQRGRRARAW